MDGHPCLRPIFALVFACWAVAADGFGFSNSTSACLPHSKIQQCPGSSLHVGGDVGSESCVCLLGCDCVNGTQLPLYTSSLTCVCNSTSDLIGAFVWLEIGVGELGAQVNYTVQSPSSLPSVSWSGNVSNTSLTVPENAGSWQSKAAALNPYRDIAPVLIGSPIPEKPVTFAFSYGAATQSMKPTRSNEDSSVSTVSGGIVSCTVLDLRVIPHPAEPPMNYSLQVSWTQFPQSAASYLVVHLLVETTGDVNGNYVDYGSITGNTNSAFLSIPRQCGIVYMKPAVAFRAADGWMPNQTWCPDFHGSVSFYVRTPPSDPVGINVTVNSMTSVSVVWWVLDSGGCTPVTFRLQLLTADHLVLAEGNLTDPGPEPSFPAKFKFVFALSPPQVLPSGQQLFVGITAISAAGPSQPGASGWFQYHLPSRLEAGMVVAIAASVIGGALLFVCVIGYLYRRCISETPKRQRPPIYQSVGQ